LTFFPRTRSSTPGAFALCGGAEPAPGYRLRRLRGRGGFAEVWEADAPTGPPIALKFMSSSNAGSTSRELRAIQSFQSLDHPYMVKTHGVWSVPGYIVIAMELADATLLDLMLVYHNDLGQHIDPSTLCLHLWQVGEALDFLNARRHNGDGRRVGFQHGDVKPNNVLLFGDIAKLTDHGLATPTNGPMTPCPRAGTRDYAAPEVFQGYLSDTSDQFSLAVTYHVLRTGVFPYPAIPAELPRSFHRPPPQLSLLSQPEQEAIARALSPAPQDRYPTCGHLTRALMKAHKLKLTRTDDDIWRVVPDEEQLVDATVKGRSRPA
jgi:serine/threonine protein kinase